MRGLARRLDDPHGNFRTIHVAGTKGKSSTRALIEAGLVHAGLHGDAYRAAARVRCLLGDPLAGMLDLFREQRAGHDVVGGVINCLTVREATIETYIADVINEPAIRVPLAARRTATRL